jgi:protein-export membrane protein SecD
MQFKNYIKLFLVILIPFVYSIPTFTPSSLSITSENFADLVSVFKNSNYTHVIEDNNIKISSGQLTKITKDLKSQNIPYKIEETRSSFSLLNMIGAKPINFGLDIKGGSKITIEYDSEYYFKELTKLYSTKKTIDEIKAFGFVRKDDVWVLGGAKKDQLEKQLLSKNLSIINNRVNSLGVSEALVYKSGDKLITIELPSVFDIEDAQRVIGATTKIEFRAYDNLNITTYKTLGEGVISTSISDDVLIEGSEIIDAVSSVNQRSGAPSVVVTMSTSAAKAMNDYTKENIGNPLFILKKEFTKENGVVKEEISVINSASIGEKLGGIFEINGFDSSMETQELAILIKSGSFETPITIVDNQIIDASLGQENVKNGMLALGLGLLLALFIMFIAYGIRLGIITSLYMISSLLLMITLFSQFGATLSMAGIAGVVLTVGMAIDSSVILMEQIRQTGNIEESFIDSKETIIDANGTTLLAAIILFSFSYGSIKGFAFLLSIGVICTLFNFFFIKKPLFEMLGENK